MKRIATLALVTVLSSQGLATGAAWLAYPHSAQNVAEAGGLGVMGQGLNALALNAAGLAEMTGKGQVQLTHSTWAADILAEHLGAATRAPWGGVMAVTGTWVDFGSVQGYDLAAGGGLVATNTIRPNAASLEAAWAWQRQNSPLSLGLGASLLRQSLDGQSGSFAPAFEAGVKYSAPAGLSLASSLVNIGGSLDGSELPTDLRIGLAWTAQSGIVTLGVELSDQSRFAQHPDILAAARLRIAEGLHASLGWAQLEGAPAQPSAGLSFTIGGKVDLDYGFRQQSNVGATHHLSLGLHWS